MPEHADRVSEHYNKHRPRSETSGELVQIRSFHNYVKARLIGDAALAAAGAPIRFLDMCCGNGGDISKLTHHNIEHYFGIDIAPDAVERACDRLKEAQIPGDAITFNAFSATAGNMLHNLKRFDIVSCQFAIHYAFASEATARRFVQNVAFALREGGRFIGTLPHAEHLKKSRELLGKRFGDQHHSVAFLTGDTTFDDFGTAYKFTFKGAVNDLEEYVVKPDVLERLCNDCGLRLVEWKTFAEFAREKSPDNQLWHRMRCTFEPVSKIYTSFHFVMESHDE